MQNVSKCKYRLDFKKFWLNHVKVSMIYTDRSDSVTHLLPQSLADEVGSVTSWTRMPLEIHFSFAVLFQLFIQLVFMYRLNQAAKHWIL